MVELRQQLLQRFGSERCLVEADALKAYECDAFTIHKAPPLAVVLPQSTAEVQWIVQRCNAENTAFLPRGAGTCLSGGPTPTQPAVVIETAAMRGILEINSQDLLATVQPGLVNLQLSNEVAHLNLHYAPDPSSQSVCTIGGNLAENSGGPHCFKYGMTTDHMLAATVVLPNGDIAQLGSKQSPRSGDGLDLLGLFTGSEGTFGIATEITVRLSPNQESIRTLLASFDSMDHACQTVSDIVAAGLIPSALEILDQATIQAVEASVYRCGYPLDAKAVLLVELDGHHLAIQDEAQTISELFQRNQALAQEEASSAAERQRLWRGRKGAFGAMGRLRPDLYVLDGVVPRSRLLETLQRFTAIGKKYDITLSNVFHAGDGNLHPNISYDCRDKEETVRVIAAGHEILQTCMEFGGSITGEHGIGSEKLEHVPLMFDANDLEVMGRVRSVFNPRDLCNPGKVIPERTACAEAAKRQV